MYPTPTGDQPPTRSGSRAIISSLIIAVLIVIADQITKRLATNFLTQLPTQSTSVVGEALKLTYVTNRGAAFGVLPNQNLFFIVVSGVVIAVIVGSYRYGAMRSPLVNLALGLQMGGALGNLADRLRLGYVVDFIELPMWPVFNVADSAICIGVVLLAFHLLRTPERAPQST